MGNSAPPPQQQQRSQIMVPRPQTHRSEPYPQTAPAQRPPPEGMNGPFEGYVKRNSVKSKNGPGPAFGFIECEETQLIYGRDVFLHERQAAGLEIGMRVRFFVGLNQRGMPQAHEVNVI